MQGDKKNDHIILPHSGAINSHMLNSVNLCVFSDSISTQMSTRYARFLWLRETEDSSRCAQSKSLFD